MDRWTMGHDYTAVMTVDRNGNVNGVSVGSATITAFFDNVIVMTGQMCGGYSCPTNSPAPQAPATVQLPTSLKFLTVTVLPDGTTGAVGCPSSNWYGIKVDIKYQVMDQNDPPNAIQSGSMIPHETGFLFSGTFYDNDIGPVPNYPTSGKYTAADGTFHDVPLGACANGAFSSLTATQNITIILPSSNPYFVRSQTWTVTGNNGVGHGTIRNAISSPGTGSDVSATR